MNSRNQDYRVAYTEPNPAQRSAPRSLGVTCKESIDRLSKQIMAGSTNKLVNGATKYTVVIALKFKPLFFSSTSPNTTYPGNVRGVGNATAEGSE